MVNCYKDYPGLGSRPVCYPCSSVGNTFTFGVLDDTGSSLTSSISFIEALARAFPEHTCLPSSPGAETKRIGRRTVAYGTDAPTMPPFRGVGSAIRIPWAG